MVAVGITYIYGQIQKSPTNPPIPNENASKVEMALTLVLELLLDMPLAEM